MTKAVLNRDICFIEAVLLWCEHGHFSQFCVAWPMLPPSPIQLGLNQGHVNRGTEGVRVLWHFCDV